MNVNPLHLILADDDIDDCLLFKEALEQLPVTTVLTQFHYGDQLMDWMNTLFVNLPDAIFLDLNMPRKNGFQCLVEIRHNESFKSIPIFIISTFYENGNADLLYKNGATFYIRKPVSFSELKQLINIALTILIKNETGQPARNKFVLTAN